MNKEYIKYIGLAGVGIVFLLGIGIFISKQGIETERKKAGKNDKSKESYENRSGFLNFESGEVSVKRSKLSTSSKFKNLDNASEKITKNSSSQKESNQQELEQKRKIKVTSPGKGEVWRNGEGTVRWSYSGNREVDIKLIEAPYRCRGSKSCERLFLKNAESYTLGTSIKNDGGFEWPSDADYQLDIPEGKYIAEVSTNLGEAGKSRTFAIPGKRDKIEIRFPKKGYQMDRSENQVITWQSPSPVFEVNVNLREAECNENGCSAGRVLANLAQNAINSKRYIIKKGSSPINQYSEGEYFIEVSPAEAEYKKDLVKIHLK